MMKNIQAESSRYSGLSSLPVIHLSKAASHALISAIRTREFPESADLCTLNLSPFQSKPTVSLRYPGRTHFLE